MRTWDITVLVICIELALQLVVGSGLFTSTQFYYTPSQQSVLEVNGYMSGNMNATKALLDGAKQTNADYFAMGMGLVTSGNIFVRLIGSIVFFYPHLVLTFNIPPLLAGTIQILIYMSYGIGIIQFVSGRSTNLMS
jgi:hypothetical protein